MRLRLLFEAFGLMSPGAPFVQFTYNAVAPIPKRLDRVRLAGHEDRLDPANLARQEQDDDLPSPVGKGSAARQPAALDRVNVFVRLFHLHHDVAALKQLRHRRHSGQQLGLAALQQSFDLRPGQRGFGQIIGQGRGTLWRCVDLNGTCRSCDSSRQQIHRPDGVCGGLLRRVARHRAEYHPVPWRSLDYDEEVGGYVVDLDREQLEKAPRFAENREPDRSDRAYTAHRRVLG